MNVKDLAKNSHVAGGALLPGDYVRVNGRVGTVTAVVQPLNGDRRGWAVVRFAADASVCDVPLTAVRPAAKSDYEKAVGDVR